MFYKIVQKGVQRGPFNKVDSDEEFGFFKGDNPSEAIRAAFYAKSLGSYDSVEAIKVTFEDALQGALELDPILIYIPWTWPLRGFVETVSWTLKGLQVNYSDETQIYIDITEDSKKELTPILAGLVSNCDEIVTDSWGHLETITLELITISSVCVIIPKNGKILGVSRKNNPNDWGLPGGKVEQGEAVINACLRETEEETGIVIKKLEKVYLGRCGQNLTQCFLATEWEGPVRITPGQAVVETKETGRVEWVSENELLRGSFGTYNERALLCYTAKLACTAQGWLPFKVLWGLK